MSLLLKALQNAARNREAAGTSHDETDTGGGDRAAAPGELSLEPVQPSARASTRTQPATGEETVERHAAPGPQQAQTVFRAGARPARVSRSAPGIFDWLARRPLVAFSTAAGLFAIGYGVYLYLQITNPGLFVAQPSSPPAPPPPAQVATAPRPSVPPSPATQPMAAPPGPTSATRPAPPAASPPPLDPSARTVPATPGAAPSVAGSVPGATGAPPPAATAASRPAPGERLAAERAPSAPSSASSPVRASEPSAARAGSMRAAPPEPAPRTTPRSAPASGSIAMAPSVSSSAATPPMASRSTARPSRPAAKTAVVSPREPAEGVAPAAGPQIVAVDSNILSAYQALGQGRLEEAEQLYRQAISSNPRNADAMLGLAAALSQQNKGDAASQLYLRVLEQDPRNSFAQAGLLNIAGRADPVAAEARLKQLIAREPSAFLYFSLGNLYSEQGQWASAQSAYFQAHNLAPDNPDYAYNLAVGLEHLSQPKIALDYYRRAVALAQSRGHAQFELARVENRIRSLEATLAQNP